MGSEMTPRVIKSPPAYESQIVRCNTTLRQASGTKLQYIYQDEAE